MSSTTDALTTPTEDPDHSAQRLFDKLIEFVNVHIINNDVDILDNFIRDVRAIDVSMADALEAYIQQQRTVHTEVDE